MDTTINALKWRFATHKFEAGKEIPTTDLDAILEAGNLMPTAFGLQPFRFISITNQEVKDKLLEATYGQAHAVENSALIVVATRTDINDEMIDEYISRIESTRDFPAGSATGFGDMMKNMLVSQTEEAKQVWTTKQAYIALGGMISEASVRGVDNHALEGFSPDMYADVLGLKEKNLRAVVVMALGYRAENEEDAKRKTDVKVRVPQEQMVIHI
jgi:nitroreductase